MANLFEQWHRIGEESGSGAGSQNSANPTLPSAIYEGLAMPTSVQGGGKSDSNSFSFSDSRASRSMTQSLGGTISGMAGLSVGQPTYVPSTIQSSLGDVPARREVANPHFSFKNLDWRSAAAAVGIKDAIADRASDEGGAGDGGDMAGRTKSKMRTICDLSVKDNLIILGTTSGKVIRWDIGPFRNPKVAGNVVIRGGKNKVTSSDKEKGLAISMMEEINFDASGRIHHVFLDWTACHALISFENGTNYYLHSSSNKPKKLTRAPNMRLESIGWNRESGSPSSTGPILLGTDRGVIFEAVYEDGKEKVFKKVFSMESVGPHSIVGIEFESSSKVSTRSDSVPGSAGSGLTSGETSDNSAGSHHRLSLHRSGHKKKLCVIVVAYGGAAKPTQVFRFVGDEDLETTLSSFSTEASIMSGRVAETPGSNCRPCLAVWAKHKTEDLQTWTLLTDDSIFNGSFLFTQRTILPPSSSTIARKDKSSSKASSNSNEDEHGISSISLYDGAKRDRRSTIKRDPPLGLAVTNYHYLVLFNSKLQAISRINGRTVLELPNDGLVSSVRGITHDIVSGAVWVNAETHILEVVPCEEDRDVWKFYLEKAKEGEEECFDKSLAYCTERSQKVQVFNAQARQLLERGNFEEAAEIFAKADQPFEEVALRFVKPEMRNSLKTYLLARLKKLKPEDKTQKTMICTWLTEIFLDRFNSLRNRQDVEAHAQLLYDFKRFLHDYKACLDPITTFNLISSHGRTEELLFYALLIEDYDRVIMHHIQRSEFTQAIETLKSAPFAKVEHLYYKYSPTLVQFAPAETIQAWEEAEQLTPTRLIPALVRLALSHQLRHGTEENDLSMQYLSTVIDKGNDDQAIHNSMLAMLAQYPNERRLIRFLRRSRTNSGYILDLRYALRVCMRRNRKKACVHIYAALGLFKEAVDLAIQVDVNLAKEMASRPEDETLRRKLWLQIARHTIEAENDVKEAVRMINEVEPPGLIQLEDILPYFPDSVVIEDFNKEIGQSLEGYSEEIERLRNEMKEYTQSSTLIREDMKKLSARSTILSSNQRCSLCQEPLLNRAFYCFGCTHSCHGDCLIAAVLPLLNPYQHKVASELMSKLYQLESGEQGHASGSSAGTGGKRKAGEAPGHGPGSGTRDRETLQRKLDSIIAAECPHCGDAAIKTSQKPFLTPEEEQEEEEWAL